MATRRLRATPWFTLFAVLTLALGIGLTTAAYSVVDALLWRPLAVNDPENVVQITQDEGRWPVMSWSDFSDFRQQQTAFASLAASQRWLASLSHGGVAGIVGVEIVNGEYFSTLDALLLRGRWVDRSDEKPVSAPVVVLSESLWRRRFGADHAIVGQTVKLAGHPFEIIGVSRGPFRRFEQMVGESAWVPVSAASILEGDGLPFQGRDSRNRRVVSVKGRLAEGIAPAAAAAETSVIGQRLERDYPGATRSLQRRWSAARTEDATAGPTAPIGSLVMLVVSLVLLIACSNLANLAMARGTSRAHDLAVRKALGATRWRLVREQLVESALIMTAGGSLAVLAVTATMTYLPGEIPVANGLQMPFEPTVSWAVLAMALGAAALSFVVFGLWPALQLTVSRSIPGLGAGAQSIRTDWRSNRRLVALQVTGAVALFLVAAVCVRTLASVALHDSGIDLDRLAVAQIDFRINGRDEAPAGRLVDAILAEGRRERGIQHIAASVGLPFGIAGLPARVTTADRPFTLRESGRLVEPVAATPTLFPALGVTIVRGRSFDDRDTEASPAVAVVSQLSARALFGSADAVGQTIVVRQGSTSNRVDAAMTIVGVASDTDTNRIGSRSGLAIYVPFAQHYWPGVTLTARTSGDPAAAVQILRSVINRVDPDLAITGAGIGRRMLEGHNVALRIVAVVVGGLGTLALVLAMTGLFGVLSHLVARRTRELGLRMALGADRRQIVRMVLADGFRPVVDGLLLGLIAGTLGRLILRASLAVPVTLFDPFSLMIVVPLAAAAAAACYLPARRAANVDPNVALREL